MYRCSRCGNEGDTGFFVYSKFTNKQGVESKYYHCNQCSAKRMQTYRATNKGSIATRKAVRKYEAANNKRRRAWKLAKKYIPALQPCVVCQTTVNIHKHHPDISKPREVVFLCALHHKEAHKQELVI